MKSRRFFDRKHPVRKNTNEAWQRKTYQAEKHRPKQAKPKPQSQDNNRNPDISWQTLLLLFLLLSSRLPRARGEASRHSTPLISPASSPVNEIILFDMCSALVPVDNSQELIQAKIVGEISSANKQDLARRIGRLRTAHADIQQMIDAVVHDPNIEIFVTSTQNIDANQQSEHIHVSGYYDVVSRYIVIPFEATSETILHEFRHAFWHIWNLARSATSASHSVQIGGDQRKLNDALNRGDERLKDYQSQLKAVEFSAGMSKESAALFGVDACKKNRINTIQASLKGWLEHYTPVRKTITVFGGGLASCKKYPVGSEYTEGLTVLACREVSTDDPRSMITVPGPAQTYVEIKTNEPKPFSNLLSKVQQSIDTIKKYYAIHEYLYEREAYLYGVLPVQLIKLLYPELLELTSNVTRLNTNVPMLKINKKFGIKLFSEYLDNSLVMSDMSVIKQLPPEKQISYAVNVINRILKSANQRKKAREILEFLWQKNHELALVANNLIEICYIDNDHRCVVETYDRALDKLSKFTITPDNLRMFTRSAYETNSLNRACQGAFSLWGYYKKERNTMTNLADKDIADENIRFAENMISTIRCKRR